MFVGGFFVGRRSVPRQGGCVDATTGNATNWDLRANGDVEAVPWRIERTSAVRLQEQAPRWVTSVEWPS